jgi:uncharacterized surface protein with fasciclin (FAS1) repeats
VQKSDLGKTLDEGEYTLLAPSNTAFEALGAAKVEELLNNPDELKKVRVPVIMRVIGLEG